jgi:ADP-heptose:LPS heptosyltransferase
MKLTGQSRRSLDLEQLAPVLELPGCSCVSLQYGDAEPEVRRAEAALGREIRVFPPGEIDDFDDLAGLVANLDLVVSVQTALVHLCGALGKTCLTLVPAKPEWRYGAAGETLPWYGSVRLFRQDAEGGWDRVLGRVARAAASLTIV